MKYSQNLRRQATSIFFLITELVFCLSLSTYADAQEPDEIFSGQGGVVRTVNDTADPGYIPPPTTRPGQDTADPGYIPGTGGESTQIGGKASNVSCGQPGADPNTCIPTGESTTVGGIGNSTTGSGDSGSSGSGSGNPTSGSGSGSVNSGSGSGNPTSGSGSGGDAKGSKSLINPIACSPAAQAQGRCFVELLTEIINIILIFAVPIIVLYIMYAGYLFVTAAGNSEKVSDARNALLWSIIGGVIVLGAKIIVEIIEGTVAGLK